MTLSHDKCYGYRRFLSQFLATTVKNLLFFNAGIIVTMPTIVIAAFTGIKNEHNQNEYLTMTSTEASWLGIISFILSIGSMFSGLMIDPFGRKRLMFFVNIPFIIGWYILYQTNALWQFVVGLSLLYFAIGLFEAPVVSYLGEICEPSTRGVLLGYTYICNNFGMFIGFLLNTLMPWRTMCLISLTVPIITAIALLFIPETPQWFLSKNRTTEAEESLRWLRGWVPSNVVAQEFQNLQRNSDRSKSCDSCIKQNVKCNHSLPTLSEKFMELKRKRTLKPIFIVISMFFLAHFTGLSSMSPFMVQIFKAYGSPIPPDRAVAIKSFFNSLSNVFLTILIRFTGKRRFYLFAFSVELISTAVITLYGFIYLPSGYISFDQAHREPFQLENKALGYIPMVLLMIWSFFKKASNVIPWMLMSEIFPFRSRGVANGIVASMGYSFSFFSTTMYYSLETTLSLPGVSLLFTCICFFGLILTYNILPETENQSLEDIELHFSDNSKGITDRKIAKHTAKDEVNGNAIEIKSVSKNEHIEKL